MKTYEILVDFRRVLLITAEDDRHAAILAKEYARVHDLPVTHVAFQPVFSS